MVVQYGDTSGTIFFNTAPPCGWVLLKGVKDSNIHTNICMFFAFFFPCTLRGLTLIGSEISAKTDFFE